MTATKTAATMTTPTKEEAAAIREWSEALRAAEERLSRAHALLGSVRGSVLREVKLDSPARPGRVSIRCLNLICEIAKHRGEAERSEKISSSVSDEAR